MNRLKVLMILFLVGMIATGGVLAYYVAGYYKDRKESENIREIAYGTVQKTSGEEAGDLPDGQVETLDDSVVIDFGSLKSVNGDTVGWLRACDGDIDGPVVQTTDNSFYLDHRFDKTSGSVGCFFADAQLDKAFDGPLTVVYGHNRKDGSMFHPLLNYKDEQYFLDHPTFTVYTEDGEYTYRVFSAYFADNDVVYDKTFAGAATDGDQSALEALFDKALERSLYKASEAVSPDDIVILSTCEYSGDNNRMVVYGVRE